MANLNKKYISERIQEKLRDFSNHSLNTVIAPIGYGKTTVVDWYINLLKNADVFRINIYSDNIDVFWENLKKTFSDTALYPKIRSLSFPKDDNNRGLFLNAVLSAIKKDLYGFSALNFITGHCNSQRELFSYLLLLSSL